MLSENVPYSGDRLRVNYTSSVSDECRIAVRSAIITVLGYYGYWHKEHQDRVSCAWAIDVTGYDPDAPHPITDGQVAGLLRSIANERGISVSQLIEAAKATL